MDILAPSASGLRHLRWGREIAAGVGAQIAQNSRLSEADRDALRREESSLRGLVDDLSRAVKPYRDFLERTRVDFRARVRAARFVGDEAVLKAAIEALERMEREERRPRKAAVREAVRGLREGLLRMNERLSERFGEAFVVSLYPELTSSMAFVLDEDDEDDDATAPA